MIAIRGGPRNLKKGGSIKHQSTEKCCVATRGGSKISLEKSFNKSKRGVRAPTLDPPLAIFCNLAQADLERCYKVFQPKFWEARGKKGSQGGTIRILYQKSPAGRGKKKKK